MNVQVIGLGFVLGAAWLGATAVGRPPVPTTVVSLDGEWRLATDPANEGVDQRWFAEAGERGSPARVPWIIQDTNPGYHGVAWYWREFTAPANPHADGRYLLRFEAVDYKADVWVNGVVVGTHEGGETPFVLDVTTAVRPGVANRLAVRVLNPTHQPIDGIVLNETPHRNKALPYTAGNTWDQGGIIDSVRLLVAPSLRVADVFARGDWRTGAVTVQVGVTNALARAVRARLEITVGPAASGTTVAATGLERELAPGNSVVEARLQVPDHRLWNLNDPFLYRVTARAQTEGADSLDESSVRCGFRDLRIEGGYFRLNGRRLFLRCSHTGNCCPVGLEFPLDPDWLRRDLLNVKMMGFNAIRFISGVARPYQLDLCDEIGLLVYEEPYAAWCLADSPHMARRYDDSVLGMVRRDRNHPSVAIWGLLNETGDGAVFRHAVTVLPSLRELDDSRLVLLNSGQWDRQGQANLAGLQIRRTAAGPDPNVTRNGTRSAISGLSITWAPGQFALHPGAKGEYSVARWTCPAAGTYAVEAVFTGIAQQATTDVHVLHNTAALHNGFVNVQGQGNESRFATSRPLAAGDTLDFVVGYGNGHYGGDTTALAARITAAGGAAADVAADFAAAANPNGTWRYGWLPPGAQPDPAALTLYERGETLGTGDAVGCASNPGSTAWEDILSDQHPYQRVPHTDTIARFLRTTGGAKPLFISEYGVGSAVDLWRAARHYERVGKTEVEDARFYRDKLDRFLVDWQRWKLDECFAAPAEFFLESQRRMARERLFGINAIRANPNVIGYSLTGTVDQGMSGEGLFTTFRELKPGTTDALFEGLAPLRLCLFASPVNVYRGERTRLEAVLANEDVLPPGEYPVRLQVVGPDMQRLLDRVVTVSVPERGTGPEPALAQAFFAEDVVLDGPAGAYRFLATLERGGAATGGQAEVRVGDPAAMPALPPEVTLWGEDAGLRDWLTGHGVRLAPLAPAETPRRQLLLVSANSAAPGDAATWRDLVRRIGCGSAAVFLAPAVFGRGDQATGWLPLQPKGTVGAMRSWLYHKDEWAKRHPVFEGLPCGGMLDYEVYREIIPDAAYSGQDAPAGAIAGGNDCSFDYAGGLMVAEYKLGAGRFLLNTLRIRETLGTNPLAEHLLRNLLRYAARGLAQPPADATAELEAQLDTLGYR